MVAIFSALVNKDAFDDSEDDINEFFRRSTQSTTFDGRPKTRTYPEGLSC